MTDLPRFTVAVTLTNRESQRLDELCLSQDGTRDQVLLWALIAYDKLITGNPDSSVFDRRAHEEHTEGSTPPVSE